VRGGFGGWGGRRRDPGRRSGRAGGERGAGGEGEKKHVLLDPLLASNQQSAA